MWSTYHCTCFQLMFLFCMIIIGHTCDQHRVVSAEIASKMINRTLTGSLSHGFKIHIFERLIQMAFLGRFHALVHARGDLRSKYREIFSLRWKTQDHETSASVEGVPKHTKRKLKLVPVLEVSDHVSAMNKGSCHCHYLLVNHPADLLPWRPGAGELAAVATAAAAAAAAGTTNTPLECRMLEGCTRTSNKNCRRGAAAGIESSTLWNYAFVLIATWHPVGKC